MPTAYGCVTCSRPRLSPSRASVPAGKVGAAPEGLLATLTRLVSEKDNALRVAALGALEVAYAIEGEGGWPVLGCMHGLAWRMHSA